MQVRCQYCRWMFTLGRDALAMALAKAQAKKERHHALIYAGFEQATGDRHGRADGEFAVQLPGDLDPASRIGDQDGTLAQLRGRFLEQRQDALVGGGGAVVLLRWSLLGRICGEIGARRLETGEVRLQRGLDLPA